MKKTGLQLLLSLALLIFLSSALHAAVLAWGIHPDKERLVLNFPSEVPPYTLVQADPHTIVLRFEADPWSEELQSPDFTSSPMIDAVAMEVSTFTISLKRSVEDHVRHFTMPASRKLVLDIPYQPLHIQWRKSGQASTVEKAPLDTLAESQESLSGEDDVAFNEGAGELPRPGKELPEVEYRTPRDDLIALSHLVRQYPEDADLHYNMGVAAYLTGNYPLALASFERALALEPNNGHPLVEMARSHLAMGNSALAHSDFTLALSKELSPQVRSAVEKALQETRPDRSRRTWDGSVALGVLYDSNPSVAPQSSTVLVGGNNIPLTPEQQDDSDMGYFAALQLQTHSWPDDRDHRSTLRLNHYHKGYDQYSEFAHSHTALEWELQGQSGTSHSWYNTVSAAHTRLDNEELVNTFSLQPGYRYHLSPQLLLHTRVEIDYLDYHDELEVLDGIGYGLSQSVGVAWGVHRSHRMEAGLGYYQQNAEEEPWNNQLRHIFVHYRYHWSANSVLEAQLSYGEVSYDAAVVPGDDVRDDQRQRGVLGWRQHLSGNWHSSLQVDYQRNHSNLDIYDYQRIRTQLGLNYRF
ncbi:surface lipoprotein assembly modifier [Desulfurispira natronophila]|uniref:Tetratricopeptide (TPR) repeat protein n=1 Tax=Desulfurispira natronophila TaxID=682562 RepID=A0A7W7Y3Y0_9BACT|nr:tetratricopeptide repeat protein [Desulfurispira natronophila]MBB5021635.1 tetratricopeptide (TPR) repeat protein [Desulfurispira natronophila]